MENATTTRPKITITLSTDSNWYGFDEMGITEKQLDALSDVIILDRVQARYPEYEVSIEREGIRSRQIDMDGAFDEGDTFHVDSIIDAVYEEINGLPEHDLHTRLRGRGL